MRVWQKPGFWIAVTPVGVVIAAQGCGPGVQLVYEGNIRFEHCYRLDLDPSIVAGHREACWREYAARYHYGQTKDRLEYARRRVRALASGDTSRPTLDLDGGPELAATAPTGAPTPTSIHKPPPPTLKKATPPDAGPADARALVEASAPPEAECASECNDDWKRCGGGTCDADASGKVGLACQDCAKDYRRCMQRCFR